MLVLDTNHMSEIIQQTSTGRALIERLDQSNVPLATTIISLEEMLRGWMARVRRERDPVAAIPLYGKLQQITELAEHWIILPWDMAAATWLRQLSTNRLRIGTMDLKIASIAIANNATLLSRNLRDFQRIPNLKAEDWLE